MPTHESSIQLTRFDRGARITLNRPAKLNAFDGEMIRLLEEALEQVAEESDSFRCVLLTGAGRGFSAGADLDYLLALRRHDRLEEFRELLEGGRRVVTRLRELPVPVIAAVNGVAAGGGGSIALACDIRIAGESARFIQAFAKIGVHADFGASFFLPRLVGESKAREWMFTGEPLTAHDAHHLGLVSEVVADEQLEAAARNVAALMASRAPLSLRLMKQSLARATQTEFQEALDRELQAQLQCFQSEDFLRRIESFVLKTNAAFVGQ